MAEINLDEGKTALLMADFATSGIGQNPIAQERHTLERAGEVLDAARNAGVLVCYCVSHFRPVPRKPIVSLIQGLSIRQVFMDVDTIRPGLYRGVAAFFPP